MSDIFTLTSIPLTQELGMALKNFRIENSLTAKSIVEHFDKASSYISKLEKGDIKKVDTDFFINLCNFISGSNEGIRDFVAMLAPKYTEYSAETKLIIMNIDDLVIEHNLSVSFTSDINNYLKDRGISVDDLVRKANDNEDILENPSYKSAPENQWYAYENDLDHAIIKMSIPKSYVEDLLSGKTNTIHSVIAEAVLYALYRLGGEKNPQILANDKLRLFKIYRIRGTNVIRVNDENFESILGGLEPDDAEALKSITSGLKIITAVAKKYGSKRIQQIEKNMKEDLGFCFAYMSIDLTELEKKNKQSKQLFLKELKDLLEKHSKADDDLELYE